ncbi:ABC transporter permease [Idiomarina tyrosinivorans]|uniref:ABC transporter permease n=1 Tax=Idiomarina tyrosinivorans TaxID=1445662 RepID=A0A432ZR31_9GAMM|nr:ABC transporter permease subunit [Idiomarina tyrosinivorans]RUO80357.1 ABC transporter permease [Idiomarina tyrosinivorans]
MSTLLTIWKKELRDAIRDKRSVLAAMSYAFFGPALMAVAFFFLISQLTDKEDIGINIHGADAAPEFVQYLNQQGIVEREKPWPSGTTPIDLTIPASWDEDLRQGSPVELTLKADWSAQKQQSDLERVEQAIRSYGSQIAAFRLLTRGIDPRVVTPLQVNKQDLATRGSKAALIMGSVLVFILMSVFWSGMNVAIDISAGERERHSLEFLLTQPTSSFNIVTGKALAASTFALFGALLTLVIVPGVFAFVPLSKIGMSLSFAPHMLLTMWLLLVPLALLAAALQLFVSFRAKNFKEAQTYISFLLIVPMAAAFGVEFAKVKTPALFYLPLTGQHQAFLSMIRGEDVNWQAALICSVITLAAAIGLYRVIAKMLRSEKTVFGL